MCHCDHGHRWGQARRELAAADHEQATDAPDDSEDTRTSAGGE